jgi:tRNA pseudouridine38-40 synthase
MRHIKFVIQYDGTDYAGWQVQKKEKTIQCLLEDAVFAVTGTRSRVTGAGRTDAGVHALHQVAVLRTRTHLKPEVLLRAFNSNLPRDVRIIRAGACQADFHPRFSAQHKTYSYFISGPGAFEVFLRRYSWQVPYKLHISHMRKAAKVLEGRHDFACFRASGCGSRHPVRTIHRITISERSSVEFLGFTFKAPIIKIRIQADAFLRHMARNIVGTLVEVGRGKISPQDVREILSSKDRRRSGPTAPAQGLFLEKIKY